MQLDAIFYCAFCGETNETTVDASAGDEQDYVEDCQVCCRPNLLHIRIDMESGPNATIEAELESE